MPITQERIQLKRLFVHVLPVTLQDGLSPDTLSLEYPDLIKD